MLFQCAVPSCGPASCSRSRSRIGNSSFEVSQVAEQAGVVCTRGTTVLVHYDFGTGRPVPIPQPIREQLQEHAQGPRGEAP